MNPPSPAYSNVLQTLLNAAARLGRPPARLLAVSKTQSADAVAALAAQGQRAFGENYVQEGVAKAQTLATLGLEWHLIGHLQSNKCQDAATHFDWVQSLDREKLVPALARARPDDRPPLNVLVQVNVDGEASKSGCAPDAVLALAIPEPHPDLALRRASFQRVAAIYQELRARHPDIDTLSLGMSEDYELAVEEGATMVRIGSLLFGRRG
jgi:PLP dependent protein